ncbi:Os05g0494050, partial [Oryza sativa Japonica Group]
HLDREPLVQVRVVEPGLGDDLQRRAHERDDAVGLHHVDVLRPGALGERPLELVEEVPDHGGDEVDAELGAGAHAAAGAEGEHPEVAALDVDVLLDEPLRPVLQRVAPHLGVPGDRPHVHHHVGALGDVVPADLDVRAGLVREHQRRRRVQPERLLDDGVQVREALEVGLRHDAVAADDAVQLLLQLLLHPGVPDQLCHCPLD